MLKPQDRPIIGRYARALFEAARSQNVVNAVRGDLVALREVLAATPALAEALRHPRWPGTAKAEVVRKAGVAPLVASLVGLLFEKARWDALSDIAVAYGALADQAAGVIPVQITTPVPLPAEEAERWATVLSVAHSGSVRLDTRVNPDLLGGATIRVGDRVWDNSLKHHLERLRESLASTRAA